MRADNIFHEIGSRGHWRVNIRPTEFEPNRIASLGECWTAVYKAQVRLLGWYYPHIQEDDKILGDEWTQSGYRKPGRHQEVWRLYQSAQFLHYLAIMEDHLDLPWRSSAYPGGRPEKYLTIVSTVYLISEIFEFAARLASMSLLRPGAEISIRLDDLEGRHLVYWNLDLELPGMYACNVPELTFRGTYSDQDLLAGAREHALHACVYFFERFGWESPPQELLVTSQNQMYERTR